MLALPFAAVLAIGYVETAEHAAVADLAPAHLRGSAFGLLALTGLARTWPPLIPRFLNPRA